MDNCNGSSIPPDRSTACAAVPYTLRCRYASGLMIECELGVTARVVKVPKIDGDYFDEEVA